MSVCVRCARELTYNEIGATKKFVNRGSREFYCMNCLAEKLGVPEGMLYEKIEQFKRQGCTLFA